MSPPQELHGEQPEENRRSRAESTIWLGGIALLLYVCSLIPLIALLRKLGWQHHWLVVVGIVFAPLEWLYNHVPAMHAFYEWQASLFGL